MRTSWQMRKQRKDPGIQLAFFFLSLLLRPGCQLMEQCHLLSEQFAPQLTLSRHAHRHTKVCFTSKPPATSYMELNSVKFQKLISAHCKVQAYILVESVMFLMATFSTQANRAVEEDEK